VVINIIWLSRACNTHGELTNAKKNVMYEMEKDSLGDLEVGGDYDTIDHRESERKDIDEPT
jgi:hypothetical protein